MSYMKGVRSGAEGNRKLLGDYGGKSGSGPAARQHYATGGAVKGYATGGSPALSEGMSAAGGAPAKPSLARPGRKMPGKGGAKKKSAGKTNVNVIIASPPAKEAGAMPPALGAGPVGPPPGPPMPPPGAGPGGPPMPPMRANGGRINNLGKYAHGGKVKREEGGRISEDSKREADKLSKDAAGKEISGFVRGGVSALLGAATLAGGRALGKGLRTVTGIGSAGEGLTAAKDYSDAGKMRKDAAALRAGRVKDGEEDRKSGGRVCRDGGGPVGLPGGSGGGLGRLAKIKKYGK